MIANKHFIHKPEPTLVKCFYCNNDLNVYFRAHNSYILSCKNNHKFPVINDVIYFGSKTKINKANTLIRKDKYLDVLLYLLQSRKSLAIALIILLNTNIKFDYFIKILRLFGLNKGWVSYLKSRDKNISFISANKILKLHQNKEHVLDLGCGTGQLLPLIYKKTNPEHVCAVDISFINLLIARKYFSDPKTMLVCMDIENRLPFNSRVFDSVIIMDTFHYITSKKRLLGECYRITKTGGRLEIIQTINSHGIAFGNIKGLRPNKMKTILSSTHYIKIKLQTMDGKAVYNKNTIKDHEPYNTIANK